MARSSRAPISFEAAKATARQVAAVEDRIADRLPVAAIDPNPRNPRHRVEAINELADSMRVHGLLQPIVVRPIDSRYQVIAGHRRLEAAKMLGWMDIAAMVRDETDDQAYILTLVENLQREDLTPKEEASALEVLIRERGWSTRQVGDAVKRSAMYVSKRLRVFEDPVLAAPVIADQLPVSTAEELLRVPDDERAQFVEQAIAERWGQANARQAVVERKVTLRTGQPLPRLASRIRALADELVDLEPTALSKQARRETGRLSKVLARFSVSP